MTRVMPPQPAAPERQRAGRRLAGAGVAAVVLVAVLAVACTASRPQPARPVQAAATSSSAAAGPPSTGGHRALPLGGAPLQAPSGLRLLVADAPAPFVLDVDRGTTQPIAGLPTDGDRRVGVLPVAQGAVVLSSRSCDACPPDADAFLVRRGSTTATRLGTVSQAVPARDGQGLWLLGGWDVGGCAIRELRLDGRRPRAARAVSCQTGLVADLPVGLLVSVAGRGGRDWHGALLRPAGGSVRAGDPQAQPVVGNLLLSGAEGQDPLVLRDLGTGASSRLRWPAPPGYGLGEVTADPNGRLAVVGFARYSPEHRLDLWLLDIGTRHWQHLPGMPAPLIPKITDVQWTADGRVVVLSADLLAVWRPGAAQLAVARVRPPRQPGGNFLIW